MDYEKLGAFYLGRRHDAETDEVQPEAILYDAKDLTTHAVCVGMTGSGKTGLGVVLLEEALIDGTPVIAIDPKVDLCNLLLTFPKLRPEDFRPWIDESVSSPWSDAHEIGAALPDFDVEELLLVWAPWRVGREGIAEPAHEPVAA